MNDYISRKEAITQAHEIIKGYAGYKAWAIVDMLRKLPAADVVEVVRCKDCKHSRFFDPYFYCYEFGGEINVSENGFCFMAERRTDDLG